MVPSHLVVLQKHTLRVVGQREKNNSTALLPSSYQIYWTSHTVFPLDAF